MPAKAKTETPLYHTLIAQIPAYIAALPPPEDELCAVVRPVMPHAIRALCDLAANAPKPTIRRKAMAALRSFGFPCPPPG
jgi:hypothetical protein